MFYIKMVEVTIVVAFGSELLKSNKILRQNCLCFKPKLISLQISLCLIVGWIRLDNDAKVSNLLHE